MLEFTTHRVMREYLGKIKKLVSAGGEGVSLAQSLLCSIAIGEKLPPHIHKSREAQRILYGFRRYKFVMHRRRENAYALTPKGERKLQNIIIDEVVIKNPKRWDGKWHLVMYDLPVRFKKAREAFRWKLKDLGFFQFQKSAWIYPYTCEGEILFVADFFGVRKHIEILEIDKILDDRKLKAHFGL